MTYSNVMQKITSAFFMWFAPKGATIPYLRAMSYSLYTSLSHGNVLLFIHISEGKFREAGPLCETHCKPRSGAAVGYVRTTANVPRSGTYASIFLTFTFMRNILPFVPLFCIIIHVGRYLVISREIPTCMDADKFVSLCKFTIVLSALLS